MHAITEINQMRRSFSSQAFVVVNLVGRMVIPFAENRVTLVLHAPGAFGVVVGLRASVIVPTGILVASRALPITLTMTQHGDMVRGPWFAIADADGVNLVYVETLLDSP